MRHEFLDNLVFRLAPLAWNSVEDEWHVQPDNLDDRPLIVLIAVLVAEDVVFVLLRVAGEQEPFRYVDGYPVFIDEFAALASMSDQHLHGIPKYRANLRDQELSDPIAMGRGHAWFRGRMRLGHLRRTCHRGEFIGVPVVICSIVMRTLPSVRILNQVLQNELD